VSSHDGFGDEPEHEEESFGRPFLAHSISAAPVVSPGSGHEHEHEDTPGGHHRPYLITGGRTGGGASGIAIETLLVRDQQAAAPGITLSAEMTKIAAECGEPVAVAEVAARIHLPIGVVQVLAGDLVSAGVLLRSESSSSLSLADDVLFIERLINGVAAL
jgi:Protein of unknown function (DUF742)